LFYVLVGFSFIVLIDIVPIIKRRSWRSLAALLLVFIPALAFALLLVTGVEVPSSLKFLGDVLKSLGLSY